MPQENRGRRSPRRPRRRWPAAPTPSPTVDPLESRVLLAAASIAADGTLEVTGTSGPDQITLRLAPTDPSLLHVQDGTTTLFVFLLDRVKAVSIDLGDGDDTLNVDTAPGLVTGAAGDLPVRIQGGAGNDALLVSGSPAAGAVSQVFTVGPDAGGGTLLSGVGAGPAQSLSFAGMESLVDTSSAASLSVLGNDGANLVELSAGPLAGGVTPTGTLRWFDVTPCPVGTPVMQAAAAGAGATAAATPAAVASPSTSSPTAAVDARDPESRREAKRLAKQARKEAQRLAKEARKEANRLARERKRAAAAAKRMGATRVAAAAAPALAAPAPSPESYVIDRAHLAVHFANKAAVIIDTAGGDDRIDLNVAGPAPAGLQALTLDGAIGDDRLADRAAPAGVVVLRTNVEATSPARDFVFETECPPAYVPMIPEAPPPPPPDHGGSGSSAATSSRGRDASSSRGASSSRDADARESKDRDEKGSKDRDASASKDRDKSGSKDRNASNGD